ncbi:MAG TPA: type VI secretion system baseplate subunit TssG [Pseudomonadota bacterium]|nr:type VI secretion system baseplate subunit TssG [Pseudomonadota bacterium]
MASQRTDRPALRPRPSPGVAATTASESSAEKMQRAICERAPRFGLSALLDAVHALGYTDEEIQLASHPTTAHQSSLVQAVRFASPPQRRVQIVLNVGLLSPQSPLPSYFQQVIDRQREGTLTSFLNFFAHHLLSQSVQGQFPERSGDLFPTGPDSLAELRSLMGLRTTYALHWIFDHLYPELGVAVERVQMLRTVQTRSVRIGPWGLGDGATLGGQAQVPVGGIAVSLFADEAVSSAGRPWPQEAERRFKEQAIPILQGHGIHLRLALVLRDQRNFLVLRPQEFLGYVPLYSGPAAKSAPRSARTVILWDGEIPSSSPSSSA